jgi:hypothetical protein
MHVFPRERGSGNCASPRLGALGITISNGCGVDSIAVPKCKTDEGIRKELQQTLHYGLEYRLGIGRRIADNIQNIGGRGLLLDSLVQLTAKARNIFSPSSGGEFVPLLCV